jgi:accessory gene regulator B
MKREFINLSINLIEKYDPDINELKITKIKYGLEAIYIFVTKLLVVSILALLFNLLDELFLFLLFYGLIRMFSFGLHLDNGFKCLIVSSITFLTILFLAKNIFVDNYIKIIIATITIILVFVYSPADTHKRPIINKKRRRTYKYISTFIATVYVLMIPFMNNMISNIIVMSLLLQIILINPLSYRLLKLPYNNYKGWKEG